VTFFAPSLSLAEQPKTSDLTQIACEFARAAKVAYPTEVIWQERLAEIQRKLRAYSTQFSNHDWSSQGGKLYVLAQSIYHKIFGYDGFYAYQAVVPDSVIDYSSFLATISQFRFFGYSQIGNKIKSAGLSGEDLQSTVRQISLEYKNKGYIFDLSFIRENPLEPTLVGLGPSADKLAMWLLSHPDLSVSYLRVFRKSLELTKNDPLAAVGLIAGLFAADATGRGNLGTILTDKMNISEPMTKFADRGGVNYHFWSYMNLALIKSPVVLRILSFGYENVLQGDTQEGAADQAGISTANIARWMHLQSSLPQICNK